MVEKIECKEKWAEENESLSYEGDYLCLGLHFQLYSDDYGQCYVLYWKENGEIHSIGCGTYNPFWEDAMEYTAERLIKDGVKNE